MKNVVYDFSSVLVDVPEPLATNIIDWGIENIPEKHVFKNPGFGREDEMHITALYGLHSENSEQIRPIVAKVAPVDVTLGKVTIFDSRDDYDVVVIEVDSEDLTELNKTLKESVVYTNRYAQFIPHVTIAYVHKNKGWNLCGEAKFSGEEFTVEHVVFSSRNGSKERIPIG